MRTGPMGKAVAGSVGERYLPDPKRLRVTTLPHRDCGQPEGENRNGGLTCSLQPEYTRQTAKPDLPPYR